METNYNSTKSMLLSTPVPAQTNTYKPISHADLIDLTLNSIVSSGFKLDKEIYRSARDGQIANGRFTIKDVSDSEMQLEIGWQNSYNKSLSLKFAIGSHIFICENGCVSGDMGSFKKKHNGNVQEFTPKMITEYIKTAGDVFQKIQKERDRMKEIELTKRQKAEIVGRMVIEKGFITTTQLNIIAKEMEAPTHDYNAQNTLWELYNYTTYAMKDIHPFLWMGNHIDAHQFFVEESGLISETPKIVTTIDMPTDISPNQMELFEKESV